MNTQVKAGPATYVGYGFSALFAGAAAWAAAENELGGKGKWLAIIAAALAALTNLNRSLQAPKGEGITPEAFSGGKEQPPADAPADGDGKA